MDLLSASWKHMTLTAGDTTHRLLWLSSTQISYLYTISLGFLAVVVAI